MNNNKLLTAILCLLLVILFVLIGFLFANKNKDKAERTTEKSSSTHNIDKPVDCPTESSVVLEETEDMGQEYIDKIYFVGDSTTYHFHKGGIDKSHIFVPENYTLMLTSDINDIIVGNKGLTISQAIKDANCEIVIITIGVNGADNFTETKYKTYYRKLIDAIQTESPDTNIILQSVFPVTKSYSDRDIGITNNGINRLNEWVKELAFEEGLKYLDTQSILKNENGAQLEYYGENDGVHMNAEAYIAIIEYIRTHALK